MLSNAAVDQFYLSVSDKFNIGPVWLADALKLYHLSLSDLFFEHLYF